LIVRKGKGSKSRIVYLPQGAVAAVKNWLKVRGDAPGALICPIRRGGHIELRRMTDQSVMTMLLRWAKLASVAAIRFG
jgi:integrase